MSEAGANGTPSQPDVTAPPTPPRNGEAKELEPNWLGTLKTLAFVVVIQLLALYITKANAPVTQAIGPIYQPAGTSPTGSVTNVLILVVLVFVSTLAAVWLARRKRAKIFAALVFIATALGLFAFTFLASVSITSAYLDANTSWDLSIAFGAAPVAILVLVTLGRISESFALVITGMLSAEVASYFAWAIPPTTVLLLPLGFALFDIYTVFRGPLKTLLTTIPIETLGGISSKIGDFSIGTGDTVFYALLPAVAYYQFLSNVHGFVLASALLTMLAVDAGVVITLYLLSRAKLLPGLPIPMFMGLAVLLFFSFA